MRWWNEFCSALYESGLKGENESLRTLRARWFLMAGADAGGLCRISI